MFQKIAKHRANDASNDVHRPPLTRAALKPDEDLFRPKYQFKVEWKTNYGVKNITCLGNWSHD